MSKSKRTAKSSKSTRAPKAAKKSRQQQQAPLVEQAAGESQPQTDCPYRPGTLYGTLFTEGNKDYIPKSELIKKVSEMMPGKSEKVVGFAYQVLKSKTHRSNKNRSTELIEGDKVKLVAIHK